MYPQVFGKYVLERELARGGMARVLLATLRGAGGFEKRLVVKQIRDELSSDAEFVRRFVEEAKTTVALSHPNIVPVYELGVELGTYFLAMEYVEGVSVAELLRAAGAEETPRLTPEEGAYVGIEVCRALDYAHRRMNVVHRDVTPRNVMVDEEGQVKVIDFGIAAPASVEGHDVFGSPGHMPPEQAAGKEVTPATDLFAVAVLLMELWSGRPPFRRKEPKDCEAAMRAPHPKPGEIDPRLAPLDEAIGSAMAIDPAARPQHADELGRALRKFLSSVDLGDVARQLGERVRMARARPASPKSERKPRLDRPPSRPSAQEIGTKTFAARDDVLGGPPSTRKLPASEPPPKPDAIETIATRPIETDSGAEQPARRRRAWAVGGALAVVVAGTVFAVRANRTQSAIPSSTSTALSSSPSASSSSATSASRPDGAATVGVGATATATATVTGTSTGTGTGTGTAPVAATGTATGTEGIAATDGAAVTLVADPGVVASYDGRSCRPPCSVVLDPGPHTFRFTFPMTGESPSTSLKLKPGERVTLRADFTGASPTIQVRR